MSYQTIPARRSYERIEDAFAEMGDGLVIKSGEGIVAFDERHLAVVEAHVFHTAPGYPNAQTGTCRCGTLPLNVSRSVHAQHVADVAAAA